MSISTSGMTAAQNLLEVASQNLANSETDGYKSFRAVLGDVYAESSGSSVDMAGVTLLASQQQFTQGQMVQTGNAFDLGIDGKGFFVLNKNGTQVYSRAGAFEQDANYYLVNPSGLQLKGYAADATGVIDTTRLVELQISQADRPGVATTSVQAAMNLNSASAVIDRETVTLNPAQSNTFSWYGAVNIFDSLGGQHTLGSYFTKTGTNQWLTQFQLDDQMLEQTSEFTFTNAGVLSNPGAAMFTLTPSALTNGAVLQSIAMDFTGMSQFAVDSTFRPVSVNGQSAGSLNQVTVSDQGFLQGSYSNGERYILGQVAVATFPSENGLVVDGNNLWSSSISSGSPVLSVSGSNGAGVVNSGFLEQSNVELSDALSEVISAQRFFQVNAKAFQAEDVLSQTLINLG